VTEPVDDNRWRNRLLSSPTAVLFVGGWMVTLALADSIGEGTEGASC
jgi:hypothetical protein